MSNKRIYELSKEFGKTTESIIKEANNLGYKVNKSTNSLNPSQIFQLKNVFKNKNPKYIDFNKEDLNSFVEKYSADLLKQLKELDLYTRVASSKGEYNPILAEQYVNKINFNPTEADSSQIAEWLLNPQYNSENIRHLSQYLENAVGQYGRAIWFLNAEKEFNYMMLPADSNNSGLINQKDYINSYYLCLSTLSKMNIKYQFPKMDLQIMQDGIGFYWIEETKDNITFLQLPTDYCYITAPWTYGWMFAIDLTYFDKMLGIPKMIPELVEAYKAFIEKRKEGFNGEKLAPYQYFNLPVDKSFCITFDPNRADKIPPLTGAMGASLDVLSYRELLKKKAVLDLWKLIAMKIPMDKENKKLQIPYEQASQFIGMIRQQMPENIVAFASPFEAQEVSTNQVNTMDKIVDLGDNNVYSALGMGSAMFGKDNKNAGQIKYSSQISFDYASTHMYSQFANLVNWILMNKSKTYKWRVKFFGNKLNKDKEIDMATKLITTTNTPVEFLMSNIGLEPFEIESFINWTNKLDIKSKMKPLQSMNTTSFKEGENPDIGGRPLKDVGDMEESGEKSREYKGNKDGEI